MSEQEQVVVSDEQYSPADMAEQGAKQFRAGQVGLYTAEDMASQAAQGWRDGYAWAKLEGCQPADDAPDVSGLVEALEWLRGAINCTPENDKHQSGVWISTKHPRIKQIDAILAAHQKQEDV